MNLRCRICGREHKANNKKFPLEFTEKRPKVVINEKRETKVEEVDVIVGYGCIKCTSKMHKEMFIKKHKIEVPKDGSKTLKQVIQEKLDLLFKEQKENIQKADNK